MCVCVCVYIKAINDCRLHGVINLLVQDKKINTYELHVLFSQVSGFLQFYEVGRMINFDNCP